MAAVLDDLDLETANFFGYSMGGWIGWCAAKHAPQRFGSFIIGGQHPYRKDNLEEWNRRIKLYEKGMDAVITDVAERAGVEFARQQEAILLESDPRALAAVATALRDSPGIEEVLTEISVSSLLIAGEADPYYPGIKRAAAKMADATLVSLPGLGHVEVFTRGDLTLPHVTQFLSTVTQELRAKTTH